MNTLALGILAAVAWGFHDFSVRFVTQRGGIHAAVMTALVVGAVFLVPVTFAVGGWAALSWTGAALAASAGVAYAMGAMGLYRAFAIGPVRLVAPIVGGYPILSVAWARLSGQPVGTDQWLAVLAVVGGVALVAVLSDEEAGPGGKRAAILWALAGGGGFAATFALGQAATAQGAGLPVILITRLAAIACIAALAAATARALRPERRNLPLLCVMGVLDATALSAVLIAGTMPQPQFAAVASSTFGVITIVLTWAFLKERMSLPQWLGVMIVFAGIGYLGH